MKISVSPKKITHIIPLDLKNLTISFQPNDPKKKKKSVNCLAKETNKEDENFILSQKNNT